MIITIMDFMRTTFTMEVDPSIEIYEIKKRICREFNNAYHYDLQKLVYQGRLMDNHKTISECNYEETRILVMLMEKSYYQLETEIKEAVTPIAATSRSSSFSSQLSKESASSKFSFA